MIGALDAAADPIKQRERGFGAGELLTGIAVAQLAGEDFLTEPGGQRVDAAGQQVPPELSHDAFPLDFAARPAGRGQTVGRKGEGRTAIWLS